MAYTGGELGLGCPSEKIHSICQGAVMYAPPGVKTDPAYPVPEKMKAWVLGDPGQLSLSEKPVPVPQKAEVLLRIDAVAICATDLEVIYHGPPASILGGPPHNKN